MTGLIKIVIKAGEKISSINPSDFMTQDTVTEVVKIVKELILP